MGFISDIFGGSPDPPPAPDYTGAANATAAGNLDAARATAKANRINQYTPYGSLVYSHSGTDPDAGWAYTQSLSPSSQQLFDQNTRVNQRLGNIAEQGVGYVQSALNKPLSLNGMYSVGTPGEIQTQASDAAYKNATRYLDPMIARNQAALDVKLANQGITQGSEAYENAISDFNQNRDQQYDAARNQAYIQGLQGAGQQFNQGTNLRQNQITEAQLLQNNPINMLNAVRTGAQMQTAQLPQQMQTAQQQGVAGPDLLGAATATGNYNQGVYNADQASKANTMNGLFSLGSAGLMAFSDRRLKRNIVRVGTGIHGLGIYLWDYIWGEHSCGVMADEVEKIMPDAVTVHPSGYKMVNYSMLGV